MLANPGEQIAAHTQFAETLQPQAVPWGRNLTRDEMRRELRRSVEIAPADHGYRIDLHHQQDPGYGRERWPPKDPLIRRRRA